MIRSNLKIDLRDRWKIPQRPGGHGPTAKPRQADIKNHLATPTRAVNATACVANYSPDDFWAFHKALFANQPAENTGGLSDEELVELANGAGVGSAASIEKCITDGEFKSWVATSTARALNGPIPNSNVDKVSGTPTVIVNGQQYVGAWNDLATFQAFVVQAAGEDFIQESTSTPTPTPTPTP